MLWIVVNGGKRLEGIGAEAVVIVVLRAGYELYIPGAD